MPEFRKFTAAILFFACIAGAAVNVNTSQNDEIASFMESESKRVLLVPDSVPLTLVFKTARDNHGRAGVLFFWGRREVSVVAEYVVSLENSQPFKGTIKADTSWLTGYCGMIECRSRPMPVLQRIDTLKDLVQRILAELNGKLQSVFREPSGSSIAAPADSIAADSIAADSVAADTTAVPPVQ
jgi:hypothetical protein